MICYNCGAVFYGKDTCESCGADVRYYRRAVLLSNRCYNDALEKAQVRNMTGAVQSLRMSLKLYRFNTDARNLLGLVYYETGEVVSALSEWVISKNLQPDDNPADEYVEEIRSDPTRLENATQTLHKFNIALRYCEQDSLDLAVIQLRKVLSMNPGFVKAHLLLALLYLNDKNPHKARIEATRALNLDSGSALGARYLKEARSMLLPNEEAERKAAEEGAVRYQSGNETIIQPVKGTGAGIAGLLGALVAGTLLGVAAAVYLILPARIRDVNSVNQQRIAAVSEESDAKSVRMAEYEQSEKELTDKIEQLEGELEALRASASESSSSDVLMKAVAAYVENPEDIESVAEIMDGYSHDEAAETASPEGIKLYESFMQVMGESLTARSYERGYEAYRRQDYDEAIDQLSRAFAYDSEQEDALFYLGSSYYESGDTDSAKEAFSRVIRLFPDTQNAENAEAKLAEINNA